MGEYIDQDLYLIEQGFVVHDENWLRHEEELSPEAHLVCFYLRSSSPVNNFPIAWVHVFKVSWGQYNWMTDRNSVQSNRIETHQFDRNTCSLLEVECMREEMRKKYKHVVA